MCSGVIARFPPISAIGGQQKRSLFTSEPLTFQTTKVYEIPQKLGLRRGRRRDGTGGTFRAFIGTWENLFEAISRPAMTFTAPPIVFIHREQLAIIPILPVQFSLQHIVQSDSYRCLNNTSSRHTQLVRNHSPSSEIITSDWRKFQKPQGVSSEAPKLFACDATKHCTSVNCR